MQILVTGGTGFLGEQVVAQLRARGHAVRVLARTRSPILDAMDVETVPGDVVEGDALASALSGCGAVFHLAGLVSRDPDDGRRCRAAARSFTWRAWSRAIPTTAGA
jgi:dihydroflavonol-4-reductase